MGLNTAGIKAVFQVAWRPSLLLPKLVIRDIRQLDLVKLRARGVAGIVIDKDNCLTKPKVDSVVSELKEAWPNLVKAFGRRNVLVVSNSAGSRDDAGLLQAESVSRHLGVPVLLHAVKKPGCDAAVTAHFASIFAQHGNNGSHRLAHPPGPVVDVAAKWSKDTKEVVTVAEAAFSAPKILVIGDRVMTDIVLANRINVQKHSSAVPSFEAIPTLTVTLWQKEGLGTRFMRSLENFAVKRVMRFFQTRRNFDALEEWQNCLVQQPTDVVAAAQSSPDALKPVWSFREPATIPSAIYRLLSSAIGRLTARPRRYVTVRIDRLIADARSQQFGFRLPDTLVRVRRFQRSILGDIAGPRNGTRI